MKLKITILAENTALKCPHAEWGFSALIECGSSKILYDTGLTGTCALNNAEYLGVDLADIDAIVLSHGHFDHCDGIETILNHTDGCEIFAHPSLFDAKYSVHNGVKRYAGCRFRREYLEGKCGASFNFQSVFFQIRDNIYMTGEVPFTNPVETIPTHFFVTRDSDKLVPDTFLDDNSIVIDTPTGLVIVMGCAHRGIVNIIEEAKRKTGRNIRAVAGGTHLFGVTQEHFDFVVQALEKEQMELIAPSHCTGPDRIFDLRSHFPTQVNPAFCGTQLSFDM